MSNLSIAELASPTQVSPLPKITFADVIASARRASLPVSHLITPDVAIVPSATSAAHITEPYILVKVAGDWTCNCPAEGRCWHQARAIELEIIARGQADTPAPGAPSAPPAPAPDTTQTKYLAVRSDLYGDWAA